MKFNQARYILENDINIPDRVYPQYSILRVYSIEQKRIFSNELKKAYEQASKNEWNKLFGSF